MGEIRSVSLPAGASCGDCGCQRKCYAGRIERRRKSVREAYRNNLNVLNTEPEVYWREVEAAIMLSRFFRFHVSGDIPDREYLAKMVEITARQKHCSVLCFTKRFEFVNEYIAEHGELPQNLHMIFSGWVGLEMVNPFFLPEAHVRCRDGSTTAREGAVECPGRCTDCAVTSGGCWSLNKGEQVVFNEH